MYRTNSFKMNMLILGNSLLNILDSKSISQIGRGIHYGTYLDRNFSISIRVRNVYNITNSDNRIPERYSHLPVLDKDGKKIIQDMRPDICAILLGTNSIR